MEGGKAAETENLHGIGDEIVTEPGMSGAGTTNEVQTEIWTEIENAVIGTGSVPGGRNVGIWPRAGWSHVFVMFLNQP